ncbi:MAG TPA: hypothetical protein VFW45_07715 [Candidatus Polarisedimenticolia bacterium]|nr:hypothetical protein [Candidatus Polarisedimenticolia bacterium]
MPLRKLLESPAARSALLIVLLCTACVRRAADPAMPAPPAPSPPRPEGAESRVVPPPPLERNLVQNGGFEVVNGEMPSGWTAPQDLPKGARLRSVAVPGAPEGSRVAEITLAPEGEAGYGLQLEQWLRLDYQTTYDLSVWVRGINLISQTAYPFGFGQECGLFFWIYPPDGNQAGRGFPSGAYPAADGTTRWALRTMRFTTPPREAYAGAADAGGDARLKLMLLVQLFGTGTIQVDDLRLARSNATPPPVRRDAGELAFAIRAGKPFFGLGLYWLPEGMTYPGLAAERVFNLVGGPQLMAEKKALGFNAMTLPWMVDPACTRCETADPSDCTYCRLCPDCGSYHPGYLQEPGGMVWVDEPNGHPQVHGDLEDMIASTRRIHREGARLRPAEDPVQILASDMPGGVFYNTYGWDDLRRFHRSEAFDIVSVLRRGGNAPPGALGSVMSMYPQTSINGIRHEARRLSDDVAGEGGRQIKPVWMLVNGGSGKIVLDKNDPHYRFAPHNAAELLAMRPNRDQLRYMLFASVANGVTGFLFYQDGEDTLLTPEDPYWTGVLLPAAAELATLEKQTGFLTRAEFNPLRYRLTGEAQGVDSILKRAGEGWILMVANSSPHPVAGVEFQLLSGGTIEAAEKLVYRHDRKPGKRLFAAAPAKLGSNRLALDLPGYGVGIYRFRVEGVPAATPATGRD